LAVLDIDEDIVNPDDPHPIPPVQQETVSIK